MEKRCPACGRLMGEKEKFCQECGAKYIAPQAPVIQAPPEMPAMPVMPEVPKAPEVPQTTQGPETPEPPKAPAPVCPKCGAADTDGERFCKICGTPLAGGQPVPAQPDTAPVQPDVPPYAAQPGVPQQENLPPMKKGNKALIIIPIVLGVIVIALIIFGFFAVRNFLADKKDDLSGIVSSLEDWEEALPSLPELEDGSEDAGEEEEYYTPDVDSWQVYTDSDLGFSMPVPDGWTTDEDSMDADGGKMVSFFSPNEDIGILVQYVPGVSSADFIGSEEACAKSAADAVGYSYYWVSDSCDWSYLSDYDAYNIFYIISEDELSDISLCYDCYVIDAEGGAYVVQVYRVTGLDTEDTDEYDNSMYDSYMASGYLELP